tara:strand:- start:1303 stop:1674 length:372 start_codon:yes stop_codon:yes gene_type:complete
MGEGFSSPSPFFFKMSLVNQLQTDFEKIRSEWSVTFTFSGSSYTGYFGEVSEESTLEVGGIVPEFDVEILVKAADFTTLPDVGDTLEITAAYDSTLVGRNYRVNTRGLSDGKVVSLQVKGLNE